MQKIGAKIASWIEPGAIEPEALAQLERTARLSFVERHVARHTPHPGGQEAHGRPGGEARRP